VIILNILIVFVCFFVAGILAERHDKPKSYSLMGLVCALCAAGTFFLCVIIGEVKILAEAGCK